MTSVTSTTQDAASSSSNPNVPRFYSQLKKAHKDRIIPELREEDLEESFVRGMSFVVGLTQHEHIHRNVKAAAQEANLLTRLRTMYNYCTSQLGFV